MFLRRVAVQQTMIAVFLIYIQVFRCVDETYIYLFIFIFVSFHKLKNVLLTEKANIT
uniref:Uncharacterized protein n=1 Tax=Glossina morsitans morsitans TaxID=37546 RepID=A0ABK9NFU7_GLOMM